jgi:hypothetical protein
VIGKLKEMGLVETEQYELIPCPASKIMSANLVDFQAIEILVSVPYDASISQILRAISHIEGIQRPVRRSEKKKLNEVHKGVLFHLVDGPISKIRIQQPWEKVFVLLQCYIAQTEIEDNTLAYEMEGMAKYAQRMLCALEEYSTKGSRNGHVAFQCLKLRWSFNNQLWSEHDGVLRKINGFDKGTVKQLRMKAITTFEHVMDKSSAELAEITGKTYSCASELRNAVNKTLQQKPKMSASIVYREGTNRPDHIVCDFSTHTKSDNVTYAFIAYSDRPGGCLMFKNNISDTPTVKFPCPESFGLITLHTIGSIPGLDGKPDAL